nr:MAG TPA: hypothetical protein [Bacteriophage sp.]
MFWVSILISTQTLFTSFFFNKKEAVNFCF